MVKPATTDAPVRRRRGEEGYNLVFLMVLVTALNVLVAAALPSWSAWQQRENEEELIFRGLQYAEAIRVFQARFGRLPVRLEELVEVEPRSIRQLWKDPIAGEQSWGLLFGDPSNPANCAPSPADGNNAGLGGSGSRGGLNDGRDTVTQGPICGVFSRADGDAIKTFLGSNRYSEWHFTVGLLVGQAAAPPTGPGVIGQPGPPGQQQPPSPGPQATQPGSLGQPGQAGQGRELGQPGQPGQQGQPGQPGQLNASLLAAGIAPDLSMRWIGRPWPEEIQAALAQTQGAGTELGQGNLPGQGLDATQDQGRGESVFGGSDDDRNLNPSNRRGNRRDAGRQ